MSDGGRQFEWDDTVVLVTGGTGTFGRAFAEALLARHQLRKIIIFSRDELKQHKMRLAFDHPNLRYFIGDIRDRERLYRVMNGVDVVIHTAGLTKAASCESNPFEAIQTNVFGAQSLIDAAIDRGVQLVMALSCAQAVNPVSLYGATKLCTEKMFVQGNVYSGAGGTRFACCRCLWFPEQRRSGDGITTPGPEVTRFWMTLDESVAFVRTCVERMRGGEIFVPKASSVRAKDLAEVLGQERLVDLWVAGLDERMHEVLISEDEARYAIELSDTYIIEPAYPLGVPPWTEGVKVADGFRYSSETNGRWLTARDLRECLE